MKVHFATADVRFPHAAIAWRGPGGGQLVTVCCKVTYELAPGLSPLAATQIALAREEQHWGSDTSRSVYMPADLVPTKPTPEVMLVGSAYAPRGTSVRSLDVKLGVGSWSKSLRMVGDRTRQADGTVSREQPFASMPIVYERAAGGAGTSNPVGITPQSPVVPNIEALSPSGTPGFGPIAPFWPGRIGDALQPPTLEDLELKGLPSGLVDTYFQSAPADQRLAALPQDIDLELVHLHPEHAHLRTKLPAYFMQASEVRSGTSAMTNLRLDTVWILTDRGLATATYRTTFAAHGDELSIALGVIASETATALPFNEQTRPLEAARLDARDGASPRLAAMTQPKPVPARKYQTITSIDARPPGAPRPPDGGGASISTPPPPPVAPASAPFASSPSAHQGIAMAPLRAAPSRPAPSRPAPDPVPPPRLVPGMMSALDASNRAADGAPVEGAAPHAKPKHEEAVVLLWFDATYAPSLRRVDEWRKLLRKAEERADPSIDSPDSAAAIEDTRDFTEVLRAGKPQDVSTIEASLRTWIGASAGAKSRPALVVRDTLSLVFDERKTLRALVSAARPFTQLDAAFKERVAEAAALSAEADDLTPAADLVAAGRALRDAFSVADRKVPPTHLEEQAIATLAARRAYKEIDIWGGRFVPVLLGPAGDPAAARAGYLPRAAADQLPLVPRVEVRAIIEIVPNQLSEGGAAAFRVRALARHLSLT